MSLLCGMKWHSPAQGKGPNDKFQLYNLRTDPGEATNVFAQEPDKAKELFAALQADLARGRSR
jgi:hypothetical protein